MYVCMHVYLTYACMHVWGVCVMMHGVDVVLSGAMVWHVCLSSGACGIYVCMYAHDSLYSMGKEG